MPLLAGRGWVGSWSVGSMLGAQVGKRAHRLCSAHRSFLVLVGPRRLTVDIQWLVGRVIRSLCKSTIFFVAFQNSNAKRFAIGGHLAILGDKWNGNYQINLARSLQRNTTSARRYFSAMPLQQKKYPQIQCPLCPEWMPQLRDDDFCNQSGSICLGEWRKS